MSDDKLIMFRQQAIIIGRKKDQLAENLKEYRMENSGLEKQLKERRKNLGDEGEVPKGEDVFDKHLTLLIHMETNLFRSISSKNT